MCSNAVFSVGSISENVLCSGFWCVRMLMFHWLYIKNILCNGFWCVEMLSFYCFYKGKCILRWILVCLNVDFLLVLLKKMFSVVGSAVLNC